MPIPIRRLLVAATAATVLALAATAAARQGASLPPPQTAARWSAEHELQSVAIVERKVMVPMRDGVRLATDIYRPRQATGRVPAVWVRTPYNFNYWDVGNGVARDMASVV